ncbi:GMC family oxidoreductase [Rhodobacteraceae bacterium B1Z28]|uniref:GMC family oxidoreductase n=1 Tax=Ruegeria haliotis TaxID=2747601 RepID=A0ABX2PXR7_9RHOB|nr:GMC oxidoreductase [Ruegeria haliotis]NVO57799.1 GMC family oxidoreductase [Ruegeria haliotis]
MSNQAEYDFIVIGAGSAGCAAAAFHPVGTLSMGTDTATPDTERLKVRGFDDLWGANASIMPKITSANTNAPPMMIEYRAGRTISEDAA